MSVIENGLSPVAIQALKARFAPPQSPFVSSARDLLEECFEYYRRERTTLASPEIVIAAACEIVRLREELQLLKVREGMRSRGRQSSVPTGMPVEVNAPGRSRC